MLESWRKTRIEHPDPKVRAEAFGALEPNDPRYLEAVRSDEDMTVRIGLVGRLTDTALLAELHGDDAHAELAAAADARLRTLLAQADGSDDSALLGSGADVDLLEFALHNAASPALRRAAFERLDARHAVDAALREALATGAADAGLRALAVTGLDDPAALERVAQAVRKSDKHVYRVAREKLAADRAEANRAQRREELLKDLAELAGRSLAGQSEDLHRRQARLQNWREAWRECAGDDDARQAAKDTGLPPEAADAVARIESLIAKARDIVERRKATLDGLHEALAGEQTDPPDFDQWRSRWEALSDHSAAEQRQFDTALDALRTRSRDEQRQASLDGRAQTLLTEWESTDWDSVPVDSKRVDKLARLWDELAARGALDEALQQRYRALTDRLTALAERRQVDAKAAVAEMTGMVSELGEHLEAGRSAEATSLHDRLVHRMRTEKFLDAGKLAGVRKKLGALDAKLKELHEWRRWGAQQARDGLVEEAVALAAQAETIKPGKLANRVKALRQKWQTIDKGVGPAPQEQWTRFDSACETAYAPAKTVFDAQAAERKENAAKKRAICERLEEYARAANWDEPDWDAAVKALDTARREWHEIGGVTPKQFARLRKRYRQAIAGVDEKLAGERERERKRREGLIEKLRAGLESEPLEDQIRTAKQAQRDWRPTVRLRRKDEQAMWKKLREVCDQIFARREQRFASRREAETEALKLRRGLVDQLAALLPGDGPYDDAQVGEARAAMSRLRSEWRAAAAVPPKERAAVDRRWRETGKALDAKLARHARRAASEANEMLLRRALLVADRAQAAAASDQQAATEVEAAWAGLDEQRGDMARALAVTWDSAGDAGAADGSDARRELCIRLEMLADVDSPAEDQSRRMALKVAMLGQAMSGEAPRDADRLQALLLEWARSAAAAPDDYIALRERFERAARALSEAD